MNRMPSVAAAVVMLACVAPTAAWAQFAPVNPLVAATTAGSPTGGCGAPRLAACVPYAAERQPPKRPIVGRPARPVPHPAAPHF